MKERGFRTKYKQKDDNGNLFCYRCKCYKDSNEFGIDNSKLFRDCKSKNCISCNRNIHERRKQNNRGKRGLDRLLLERWFGNKQRNKGVELDYDWTYLKQLWYIQEGRCAISGIEMTYIMDNGRIPTNISVDRIDSKVGYCKNNLQLVCMAINQMKSDLSIEELIFFCKHIITNNEYKYQEKESWEVYSLC